MIIIVAIVVIAVYMHALMEDQVSTLDRIRPYTAERCAPIICDHVPMHSSPAPHRSNSSVTVNKTRNTYERTHSVRNDCESCHPSLMIIRDVVRPLKRSRWRKVAFAERKPRFTKSQLDVTTAFRVRRIRKQSRRSSTRVLPQPQLKSNRVEQSEQRHSNGRV